MSLYHTNAYLAFYNKENFVGNYPMGSPLSLSETRGFFYGYNRLFGENSNRLFSYYENDM
ncbi:MAG: hypothetical protein DYG84_11965 [Candidatus Brocadia sp. AMX3]|jgi:hypothetical protein|nr:hypothetical protein [Candidatus Brocadia sp. AMX3]OQY98511.1 MAG: hypothetical protein B6D35_11925 [Candidatus Brocadia sp. UTAMX2]